MIVEPFVEPMDRFAALAWTHRHAPAGRRTHAQLLTGFRYLRTAETLSNTGTTNILMGSVCSLCLGLCVVIVIVLRVVLSILLL